MSTTDTILIKTDLPRMRALRDQALAAGTLEAWSTEALCWMETANAKLFEFEIAKKTQEGHLSSDPLKVCHVCHDSTQLCCSDCAINFGARVYVCGKRTCWEEHDRKCFGDGP